MKKPHQLLLGEKQLEMIEQLKEDTGTSTTSGIFFQALTDMFRSYHPSYKNGSSFEMNGDTDRTKKKATAKVNFKLEQEKAKENMKTEERVAICENLFKGEAIGDVCVFKSYGLYEADDTTSRIALSNITEEIFENNVFFPSKDKVFDKRPEVKNIWKQK